MMPPPFDGLVASLGFATDTPYSSFETEIPLLRGPNGTYKWPIYNEEEARLTEMLGVDFKKFDIGGTLVMQPPLHCEQCGKRSGFDDFVHEALTEGIHSTDFILRILHGLGAISFSWSPVCTRVNNTDPNTVKGEVALFGWSVGMGWAYGVRERDQDTIHLMDEKANAMKADEAGVPRPTFIERDPRKVMENGVEDSNPHQPQKEVLNIINHAKLVDDIEKSAKKA
ncbi:RBP-like protein [Fusarium acutatum]|uniref:RBP-like protein n=1 Tax=Fusarium acutatum TaxID=78861 RepID=A0A8H4JRN6_9HYPO|nr:RBP-like protein [Fusarium acutatum]